MPVDVQVALDQAERPAAAEQRTADGRAAGAVIRATSLALDGPDRGPRPDGDEREQHREVDERQSSGAGRPDRPERQPAASATPCHSGVSQASGWTNAGSDSTGKNVPENRNSGVIPNRKIALNWSGVRWVAENAAIGVGEGQSRSGPRPGSPARSSGEIAAPNSDDDHREDRGDQQQPDRDPDDVAEGDVARPDRRRVHRVVDAAPGRGRP